MVPEFSRQYTRRRGPRGACLASQVTQVGSEPAQHTVAVRQFDGNPSVAREGRQLFLKKNCYGCHGGLAGGGMGPSLRDTTWKYGGTDEAIYKTIHDGRPFGMPTWGNTLTSDEIRVLVVYIKSLRTTAEPKFFFGAAGAEDFKVKVSATSKVGASTARLSIAVARIIECNLPHLVSPYSSLCLHGPIVAPLCP